MKRNKMKSKNREPMFIVTACGGMVLKMCASASHQRIGQQEPESRVFPVWRS